VKHILTGPYPLQITFEGSKVKNSQPNIDKKTSRKETRENKHFMHDDGKREETTKEETRVLDTSQSYSAINVDDNDDDKKADDPDITPFDSNKVRNMEDGNDKVEDNGMSSLANTQYSKNASNIKIDHPPFKDHGRMLYSMLYSRTRLNV
jgi:hypothetical protein